MSNILSKIDITRISDQESDKESRFSCPLICYGLENLNFESHIIGTIPIYTVESDLYDS